ncbi:acyl-ACP--UDP-N-acetylglucosamine O-acyltransferase [Alkalicaulis satelles]|uniref:Acyl-ACP--UDP-N-acetylglucosamine O-acyltransferase n=1 Tax=Alkalicaulis satelles TaxID=2609175 RepID=A0A5M6ZA72_9PROT|nr:acyl-ACP--UDP-N-acetylglucosamine O-acyltransferase [Alkalicaulis satelles]KAA5801593.1 acyl-ACP--UDP-N-acetylglucosamine O-acyltransferase [Alkalicaulis satelles]
MSKIHPTALIDPSARIGQDVEIGPYCVIGPHVEIGARTRLLSHVSIQGWTRLGEDCVLHPFVAVGEPPQDFKYKDGEVRLEIGVRNTLREHVTMHLGTPTARGVTRVGSGGYFMVGSHVAHDCIVGDNVVFANNATLGGESTVGDFVIMGGLSALHQKCRVGRYAFIGGGAPVTGDVIPYGMVDNDGWLAGLNLVGLKRRGFSRETIHNLRAAYRLLYAEEGAFNERIEDAARLFAGAREVMDIIEFIKAPAARPLAIPEPR